MRALPLYVYTEYPYQGGWGWPEAAPNGRGVALTV